MELTKQQSAQFITFYMNRYAKEWETTLECSTRLIEEWIYAVQSVEYKAREDFFRKILWKKADDIYKVRQYWPETVLHKVMWSMWLNYWPKFIRSFTNYSKEYIKVAYPWRSKLIIDCFDDIQNKYWCRSELDISYMKEKYWSIRFEYSWADEEVSDMLEWLLEKSEHTCFYCWKKWKLRDRYWVLPLCWWCNVKDKLKTAYKKLLYFVKKKLK